MKFTRAAAHKYKHRKNTVRVKYEPDYDHEAWSSEIPPTPESTPDAFYRITEPAHPKVEEPSTRRKPHLSLTASKIRNRLYSAGIKGAEAKQFLNEILAGEPRSDGVAFPSWSVSGFRQRFGRRVTRAVLRFVRIQFFVLDEFGYYATPGLADFVQKAMSTCRKHNAAPIVVEQSFPTVIAPVIRRVSFQR